MTVKYAKISLPYSFNKLVGTRCIVTKQATLLIFENLSALFFRYDWRKLRNFSFTVSFSFVGFIMLILWFFSWKRLKTLAWVSQRDMKERKDLLDPGSNFFLLKGFNNYLCLPKINWSPHTRGVKLVSKKTHCFISDVVLKINSLWHFFLRIKDTLTYLSKQREEQMKLTVVSFFLEEFHPALIADWDYAILLAKKSQETEFNHVKFVILGYNSPALKFS